MDTAANVSCGCRERGEPCGTGGSGKKLVRKKRAKNASRPYRFIKFGKDYWRKRLTKYIDIQDDNPDACWIWKGPWCNRKKYGVIRTKFHQNSQKYLAAHRIVFWAFGGGWLHNGDKLFHICSTGKKCVNPLHMMKNKTPATLAHLREQAEKNGFIRKAKEKRKLTDLEIWEIKYMGSRVNWVARKYGVSPTLVSLIRSGKRYPHIKKSHLSLLRKQAKSSQNQGTT